MGKATGKINLETFSELKSPTQYFWFEPNTAAVGQGAHVTNISEPAFISSADQWETMPTNGGYNLLLNTNGIKLRNGKLDLMSLSGASLNFYSIANNGSTSIAEFGASGARIGQTSGSHFTFSQYAIQALDGSGNVKLSLSPDGLSFGNHTAAKQADLTTEINQRKATSEVMGEFTILWNYSSFTQAAQAQFYICGFDPVSGTASNSDGWVKWNDSRVTLPKININPAYYGNFIPYYIPIFIVFNTTSPSSGYNLVWFNELTKSWVYPVANADPQSQEEIPWLHSTWSWNSNHIILGRFSGVKQTLVESDGSESFNNYLSEYEIFKPPRSYKQISNANISNSSLLEELNTLQSGTPRWQYTNNEVVYDVFFDSESSSSDSASSLYGGYYYIDSNGARQNIAFSSLDTTTETIEEDGETRTIQVPIVYFDNGLSPLQSQVSDLEGTSDDLNNRVSTLENAIEINPNPDDGQPYILIRSPEETVTNPTGTTSDEPAEEEIQYASTRFTPDRISFLKGDDEVLYISSRDEAGLIDINSANIHNFIRIGQMEIFTASDNGIAIRKGIEDEEE